MTGTVTVDELRGRVADLLATHDPASTARLEFLRARFDAGLAWVHFPVGLGGLAVPRALQQVVDAELAAAGAPYNDPQHNLIGLGMAGPTSLRQRRPSKPDSVDCSRFRNQCSTTCIQYGTSSNGGTRWSAWSRGATTGSVRWATWPHA